MTDYALSDSTDKIELQSIRHVATDPDTLSDTTREAIEQDENAHELTDDDPIQNIPDEVNGWIARANRNGLIGFGTTPDKALSDLKEQYAARTDADNADD